MYQFSIDALNEAKDCGRKAFFQNLSLGQYSQKAARAKGETIAMKNCLVNYLTTGEAFTKESFGEMLDSTLYYAPWQKEEVANQCFNLMHRFVSWSKWAEYECISGNFTQNVTFGNVQSSVSGDFVLRRNNDRHIIMCKIVKNAPTLSNRARTEKNKPSNSFLLAGLYKAGQILYPNAIIETALFHLKSKDDKANDIVEEYDIKPGKNVITYAFSEGTAYFSVVADRLAESISLRNCIDCRINNKCVDCNYFTFCKSIIVSNTVVPETTLAENAFKVNMEPSATDEQQAVIDADKGLFVVNAAAGCGKTFTLTKRIVKLIENGVKIDKILAITFTNKAAAELKSRVKDLCAKVGIIIDERKLNIFTFNAFGHDIISEHKKLLGFEDMRIAEKIDLFDIIFEICAEKDLMPLSTIPMVDMCNPVLQFMNKKGIVPFLWEYFNKIKVKHWTTTAELETDEDESAAMLTHDQAELILQMYNEFMIKLKERNLVEYQDQINLTLKLFENYPEVKSRYQFDHIMVDEYQDTDTSQVLLLKHLLDNSFESFMVVGDDAQAIYAFRLADYTNIIEFENHFRDYGEIKSLKITKNFRSTQEILNLGNEINHHHAVNQYIAGKDLVGLKHGLTPVFIASETENVEFDQVKRVIEEIVAQENTSYNDIAIIARTRNELNRISWFLEENQIPNVQRLTSPLISDKDVIAIKCIAETLSDTDNRFSFLTELAIREDVEEMLDLNATELFEYVDSKIKAMDFPENFDERLLFFYNYCDTNLARSTASKKLINILKEKDFENFVQLNEYLTQMFDFEDSTSIDDESALDANAITLITAHTAKGKEWRHVILLADQFANLTRDKEQNYIPNERRLLFVAVTRARDSLTILQTNEKTYDFLSEMGNTIDLFIAKEDGSLIRG